MTQIVLSAMLLTFVLIPHREGMTFCKKEGLVMLTNFKRVLIPHREGMTQRQIGLHVWVADSVLIPHREGMTKLEG